MASTQAAPRPFGSFRSRFGLSSSMNSSHTATTSTAASRTTAATASTYASRQRNPATNQVPLPTIPVPLPITTRLPRVQPDLKAARSAANQQTSQNQAFVRNTKTTSSWDSRTFYSAASAANNKSQFTSNRQFRGSGGKPTSQQRSPNSSSGTSVESIVPKYGSTLHDPTSSYIFSGISQKRVHSQHRVAKENIPANKKTQIGGSTGTVTETGTSSSSSSGRSSLRLRNFSSKFPQGLPFEDEFYKRRSHSITSDTSKYSSYSSYDNNNNSDPHSLPFEDEFARKPSNEPLYVDFSKTIPAVTQAIFTPKSRQNTSTHHLHNQHHHNNHHHHHHHHVEGCPSHQPQHTLTNHNNHNQYAFGSNPVDQPPPSSSSSSRTSSFFAKFESVSKGLGRPKATAPPSTGRIHQVLSDSSTRSKASAADQQVVYVAMASWVPQCNNHHHHQQQQQHEVTAAETPISSNVNRVQLYVFFLMFKWFCIIIYKHKY